MQPDLPTAVGQLVAVGCDVVTVVPVFFGQGGHVRKDLPLIIEQCQALHPSALIKCAGAVGEDDAVLDAVAEYCLRQV
jgi:sirohydrochlorin cobaltochelatase